MAIISTFYKRLRDLCEERGMTVNELVKILDLSSGSPTAWKNGTVPRESTLIKIAAYFGVTKEYITGEDQTPTPQKENTPDETNLTEGEKSLIELFRKVPRDRQELVLQMIEAALKTL